MQIWTAKYRLFTRLVLFLALSLSLGQVPIQAQDNSLDMLFTIRAIKVDEIAARASLAQKTAFLKAEKEAYQKLLVKLTQPEHRGLLPELNQSTLQGLVSGIDVVEEQSSSRRYLATLDIRFEPSRFSSYLAQYNVPHILSTGGGIIVLHTHKRGLTNFLWESDQIITDARKNVDWPNRIRQYVFPEGKPAERLMLTTADVDYFDKAKAQKLARQYGVQAALMIASEYHPTPQNTLTYRYFSTDGEFSGQGELSAEHGETAALAAMYDHVLDLNDSNWRQQLLVDTSSGGEMIVSVPATELRSFQKIYETLEGLSLVQEVHSLSINIPISKLKFSYTGSEDQLKMALHYAGLNLETYMTENRLSLKTETEE